MSQATSNQHDPDMLDEYDFSWGFIFSETLFYTHVARKR